MIPQPFIFLSLLFWRQLEAADSSDGPLFPISQIQKDRAGQPPMSTYRRFSLFGGMAHSPEGFNTQKKKVYSLQNTVVSEEEFKTKLRQTSLSFELFSRLFTLTNLRGYPNQDNFLIDIFVDKNGRALFSSYIIWDGHGACGHIFSELFRQTVMPVLAYEFQEILDDVEVEGSYLSAQPERRNRMVEVVKGLFATLQEQYITQMLFLDQDHLGFVSRALHAGLEAKALRPGERCGSGGSTMSAVIIDHEDDHLFISNVGDSPVFVKLTNSDQLIQGSVDHGVGSHQEIKLIIERLRKARYSFVADRQSNHPDTAFYRWRSKAPQGSYSILTVEKRSYGSASYDFRIDGLQLGRALGHREDGPGISQTPDVVIIDLAATPVDYVFMCSDGITQSLFAQIERDVRSQDDLPPKVDVEFKDLLKPTTTEMSALEKLLSFTKTYHKYSNHILGIEAEILHILIDAQGDGLFNEDSVVLREAARMASDTDDATAILIKVNKKRPAISLRASVDKIGKSRGDSLPLEHADEDADDEGEDDDEDYASSDEPSIANTEGGKSDL